MRFFIVTLSLALAVAFLASGAASADGGPWGARGTWGAPFAADRAPTNPPDINPWSAYPYNYNPYAFTPYYNQFPYYPGPRPFAPAPYYGRTLAPNYRPKFVPSTVPGEMPEAREAMPAPEAREGNGPPGGKSKWDFSVPANNGDVPYR